MWFFPGFAYTEYVSPWQSSIQVTAAVSGFAATTPSMLVSEPSLFVRKPKPLA